MYSKTDITLEVTFSRVTYVVSCSKDVPHFIVKTGVGYFKTVSHPVLRGKSTAISSSPHYEDANICYSLITKTSTD